MLPPLRLPPCRRSLATPLGTLSTLYMRVGVKGRALTGGPRRCYNAAMLSLGQRQLTLDRRLMFCFQSPKFRGYFP